MKMTTEQLKALGYVEFTPGVYTRTGEKGISTFVDKESTTIMQPHPPKRIRQSTKPLLNKLESEWLAVLQQNCCEFVASQAIRFKLANGLWYKVDFVTFSFGKAPCCWEVKGPFAHRGGFENIKMAAHQYPYLTWKLVWKDKATKQWQEQVILP